MWNFSENDKKCIRELVRSRSCDSYLVSKIIDFEWCIDFEKCETKYLRPKNLVRYVIEVPAGTVKTYKIRIGDILLKK